MWLDKWYFRYSFYNDIIYQKNHTNHTQTANQQIGHKNTHTPDKYD